MPSQPIKILGIPGSLREHSYNRGLIHAAHDVAPEGVEITMYLLHDIPFYNADIEAEGDPQAVTDFKNAIANADALLIATPQYNRSVPGVLKNAIDWASRKSGGQIDSVLADKPIAIVGVTPGKSFTEPAQIDLRAILAGTRSRVMSGPEVKLGAAEDRYAENPSLPDEETRQQVRAVLDALVKFIPVAKAEAAAAG